MEKPIIVCLCGSTKFKDAFTDANQRLTLEGNIVLSVGVFSHSANIEISESDKHKLDELHKRKIDLADKILILNVGGYIGNSTQNEIEYATQQGKHIEYLEKM